MFLLQRSHYLVCSKFFPAAVSHLINYSLGFPERSEINLSLQSKLLKCGKLKHEGFSNSTVDFTADRIIWRLKQMTKKNQDFCRKVKATV